MFFGVAFFYIQSMNNPKINHAIGYVILFQTRMKNDRP